MTVASLRTVLEDHDAATIVSNNSRYGSGPGASSGNNENAIQGAAASSRRVASATDKGFGWSVPTSNLVGQHVSFYAFCTHWSAVTDADIVIASGTGLADFDGHTIPSAQILYTGGWLILTADVDRVAEIAGGSFNPAAVNELGLRISIGSVGGSVDNLFADISTYGASGYRWTGINGSLADFRTFESTQKEGVFVTREGVDYCTSRIEAGDGGTTTTDLTDSGFTITFPDQSLVAADYMGITIDDAGGTLSNATIQSGNVEGATRRPDFIDIGATARTRSGLSLLGMRLVQLSSAITYDGGIVDTLELTQGGAEVKNATLRTRAASQVAAIDDGTFGSTSGIHDVTFEQVGSGHAIELTGDVTLTNIGFSGYGGTPGTNSTASSGANDAALLNDTGTHVTVTVNGGNIPSVRNGVGSTTTIVADQKVLTVTGLIAGQSEVRVRDGSVTLPNGHINPNPTDTFTMNFDAYAQANKVKLQVTTPGYDYENKDIELFNENVTENLNLIPDPSWVPNA